MTLMQALRIAALTETPLNLFSAYAQRKSTNWQLKRADREAAIHAQEVPGRIRSNSHNNIFGSGDCVNC